MHKKQDTQQQTTHTAMKKYIKWGALVFLVLCAFFSFTQIRKNTISGQITGAGEGDRIFLASYHASKDKFVTDDSAKVASDGTFTIKTQDKNELTLLFLVPKGDTLDISARQKALQVFLEGLGKYTVNGTAENFSSSSVSGGVYEYPEQKTLDSLNTAIENMRAQSMELRKNETPDTAAVAEFNRRWNELWKKDAETRKALIENHNNDAYAAYILNGMCFTASAETVSGIQELYGKLGEKALKTSYAKTAKKRMDNINSTVVGNTAPDFTLTSIEGDTVSLSSLRGKWVILEFWASWCKPCRSNNPHMVGIYEKYNPKGVEVIGIASWDKDEDWKKAVDEDDLPWINVNSAEKVKGQDNVSETYVINSVPTSFLINTEGIIVYRGHPAYIEQQLENYVGK